MRQGTIITFFAERSFGFIRPDDGGPDVFVHVHGLALGCRPDIGASVVFDVEMSPGSTKPRALNVRMG